MGKIISNIDFKFIINDKRNISIAIFEVELNNKSKITVIGYNEFADFCYSRLKKNDNIAFQGYISSEIKVILEDIKRLSLCKDFSSILQ